MGPNDPTRINKYTSTLIAVKASQLVGCYGFTRSDRLDLEQELVLAVLEAEDAWDATRASRNTFNNRIVNRKIATIIRSRTRQCRDHRREDMSLDEFIVDDDGTPTSQASAFADDSDRRRADAPPSENRVDLPVDVRSAIGALTPEQQRLCSLLSKGSAADAARIIGVSRPTVFKQIRAIRERFASRGLNEYLHRGAYDSHRNGVCDQ